MPKLVLDISSLVMTLLTGVTLAVLIKYTVETYRLRTTTQDLYKSSQDSLKEARWQNEMSILPTLVISSTITQDELARVSLRNIGRGAAMNITMKGKDIDTVRASHPDVLSGGDERRIRIEFTQQDRLHVAHTETDLYQLFIGRVIPETFSWVISYQAVNNLHLRSYCSIQYDPATQVMTYHVERVVSLKGEAEQPIM